MGSPQEAEIFYLLIMVVSIGVLLHHALKRKKPPAALRSDASPLPDEQRAEETAQSADDRTAGIMQKRMNGDVTGVFVVVTTGEPQTQMVAMSLSNQFKAKGKSVQVLLCGPGGDLALRGSTEISFAPLNKSPQALLKNLINNGVTVEVCPFYLPAKGRGPEDLIDGVAPAAPPVVAEAMLESGIKLFTF